MQSSMKNLGENSLVKARAFADLQRDLTQNRRHYF